MLNWSARRRDAQFKRCVVRVEEAWADSELDALERYATPWLCDALREQRTAFAARGRMAHQKDTKVERLEIVTGGAAADTECLARITSTSKHWVTDTVIQQKMTGSPQGERVSRYWRFVRDGAHGWRADEIGVTAPEGWPATTLPEPL